MEIHSAKDLIVYQKAFALAMEVFRWSKSLPAEERYAMCDQVRRCTRSVCQNLREAWAKRRYEAHFISKLSDSDGENAETETCLDFALECGYLDASTHAAWVATCTEIGKMLGSMMRNSSKFLLSKT